MRKAQPLPFQADLDRLVARLIGRYASGRSQLTPEEIGELAWGVSTLWEGFTGERSLAGVDYLARPELLHAYCVYYLPRSFIQGCLTLRHLSGRPPPRRVLDLGSGPGSLLLAVRDVFAGQPLDLWAVDHDPRALKLAAELTGAHTLEARLPKLPQALQGPFDLITAGLVVNELFREQPDRVAKRSAWIREVVWPRVNPGGSLVIIEPALRETGREALQLRDLLVASGLRVVAPCTRQGPCPALEKDRDWCHAGLKFAPHPALAAVGRSVGIDAGDLRFSYLIFTKEDVAGHGPALRVVSEPMAEKGRTKIWVCGEPGRFLLDRQDKHRSPSNQTFDDLVRDDLVIIEGAEEKGGGWRLLETSGVRRTQTATGSSSMPDPP